MAIPRILPAPSATKQAGLASFLATGCTGVPLFRSQQAFCPAISDQQLERPLRFFSAPLCCKPKDLRLSCSPEPLIASTSCRRGRFTLIQEFWPERLAMRTAMQHSLPLLASIKQSSARLIPYIYEERVRVVSAMCQTDHILRLRDFPPGGRSRGVLPSD